MRFRVFAGALTVCTLVCAFATPSQAYEYETVAEALAAVRSGKQKEGRFVRIKKATITTAVVEREYDGPDDQQYTTWFYVNDRGRDGDGILVTLPNHWYGADPFNEDSDYDEEFSVRFPKMERGTDIEITGFIDERYDDSGGFRISRTINDWNHDDSFYDFLKVKVVEDLGDKTYRLQVRDRYDEELPDEIRKSEWEYDVGDEWEEIHSDLTVHGHEALPTSPGPSGIVVTPNQDVRPGELIVVSGLSLGDRAKVGLDGKRLGVSERRPGILVTSVPSDLASGTYEIEVRDSEVGVTSDPVTITVLRPEPPAPSLTSAARVGSLLLLKGADLVSEGELRVYLGSHRLESIVSRGKTTVLADIPAGVSGNNAKVTVGGRESNSVPVGSPAPVGVGQSGGILGSVQ